MCLHSRLLSHLLLNNTIIRKISLVGGVCDMCMCLARVGVGCVGESVRSAWAKVCDGLGTWVFQNDMNKLHNWSCKSFFLFYQTSAI